MTTPTPLVVGFDLDMTLADPRQGVVASYAAMTAETGVAVDGELAASRLGPPLETEIARWAPAEQVPGLVEVYRRHFAGVGVDGTRLLPGALDTLDAVRAAGGASLVVTAKSEPLARATVDRLGLVVDDVVGWRWGAGKGEVLAERGASVYVGDSTGDMLAGRTCGATAVAVLTGPDSREDMLAAGADVVLDDLTGFPVWLAGHLDTTARATALGRLTDRLRALGSVLVAFSGGADSAFLLAAAVRALGPNRVVAATGVSPSLPGEELTAATGFAASLGVRHVTPTTDELARPGYRANAGDRCRFCKTELLDVLAPLAAELGLAAVATGTNADDAAAGFRPGIRAAAERGAVTPLLDAGWSKAMVRATSREWGLVTWDKPAAACLSSRIAYGVEVSAEKLGRVETAERGLRAALDAAGHPSRNLRVRDLGDVARVEVDAALVPVLSAEPDLLGAVRGFARVEVDPRGFRSGSMNELLPDPARWR